MSHRTPQLVSSKTPSSSRRDRVWPWRPFASWRPTGASPSTPRKTPPFLRPRTSRATAPSSSSIVRARFSTINRRRRFQGFIRGGGGLAAVHQGVTTLDKWPWYVALVGGVKFAGHPEPQQATVHCEIRDHAAAKELPETWTWFEEWYNFEPNPRSRTHVLMTVDEASYKGGKMGKDHPVSWFHEAEGGRVWCTALGHTKEGYALPLFRKHLLGGIRYAAGLDPANAAGREGRRAAPRSASAARFSKMRGSRARPASRRCRSILLARRSSAWLRLAGPPEEVAKIEDRTVPGGPRVRIYAPAGPGPKPALIYFHGGGWVLAAPETIDVPCRRLANASGCVGRFGGLPPCSRTPFPDAPR